MADREALIERMARAWLHVDGSDDAPVSLVEATREWCAVLLRDPQSSLDDERDRAALAILRGAYGAEADMIAGDDGDHAGEDYRREREHYKGDPVTDENRVLASMRVDFEMDALSNADMDALHDEQDRADEDHRAAMATCGAFGDDVNRHCGACGHCIEAPNHPPPHRDRCGHEWWCQ